MYVPDLASALLTVTTGLLCAVASWLLLVWGLSAWRPTARWAARLTPRVLRAALFTGVTGAVALAPVRAGADGLDGLPLPDRPVTASATDPPVHVVQAGDSLWAIAAATLGTAATLAEVATATQRWHLRNRAVIGPNPDVIQPGQRLIVPTTDEAR